MTTINPTLNFLENQYSECIIVFSRALTTLNRYLYGANLAGDGFPMPVDGVIHGLRVYDKTNDKSDTGSVEFSAGDRISVYAENNGDSFTLTVKVNDSDTAISVSQVNENTDVYACVYIRLQRT